MKFQTSCSELLVDTAIYKPKKALKIFSRMFKELEWECNPVLSLELLKQLEKANGDYEKEPEIVVYDRKGNRAYLQYGDNGYITTGYRFDSQCNQCDDRCFPIFKEAIEKLNGELIACDGGSTDYYEKWKN